MNAENFWLDKAYAYATKYEADYYELCDLVGAACAQLRAENNQLREQLAARVPDSTDEAVCSKIVGRYVVEKRTGGGFWPYCVRAVGGSRELFIGQKNKCDEVAQALQSACLDGAFMMKESAAPGRISEDWTSTDHYNDGWNDCRDAMLAAAQQPAVQPEQPAIPAGKVLVPLRMNAEMERVAQEEGWSWADMLEAAEATTLEQDAIARRLEPEQPAVQSEPVGYMNAGHVHELKQGRLPYGYVYPVQGTGAEIAVFTHPQPERVALTITRLAEITGGEMASVRSDLMIAIARAVEAAHGIKP